MNFSLTETATGGPEGAPTPAPTRDLPELQRPASRKGPGAKTLLFGVLVVLAVAGAIVVGMPGGVASPLSRMFASTASDVITYELRPASLPVTVVEKGTLESSNNQDVYCNVEGQTTIISILAEGSRVKKGDTVCELDSAALKDQLTNQVIATEGAKAAYQNAKLTREVAEIAVIEYKEGVYLQELQTVKGEMALAEAEQKRAVDRLAWSDRMRDKGYVSIAQNIADKVTLQQKVFTLEQSQTKRKVLEKYTKDKTIKELQSDVEKARSDELAKEQTWDLEKKKQAKLEKQIANCTLVAPADGLVVYANDPNRFGGSSQPQIEEGATVRERQKIFSLPDINRMRVNTKVHESMIDRLSPGLRARIRVDAFADQVLTGTVESVAPLPDSASFFSSDVKVYTTLASIDKGLPGLRPGMTAQVEILVAQLDNVLSVPVQAVLEYKGKDHVAVKKADGWEWREVTLGTSNDKLVEIRNGLKSGERVALSPILLMSEEEKREAFGADGKGKDATKKDWGETPKGVGTPGAVAGAGAPGAGAGAEGKEKAKGKTGQGKRGAGGSIFAKIPAEVRAKLKGASPEERTQMLKDAGLSDAEIEQMNQFRQRGGGGGGGGGFGGPGGPGGGGGGGFGGPRGGGGGGGGFGGGRGGSEQ